MNHVVNYIMLTCLHVIWSSLLIPVAVSYSSDF